MRTLHSQAARAAVLAAAPHATVILADPRGADGLLALALLSLPAPLRRQGHGTQALLALTAYADAQGLTLALTPDAGFGTPIVPLTRFYRAHGFTPNHGRHKDYRTQHMMIRVPLDTSASSV